MTDRVPWVARINLALNVRRLMYQTLIWLVVLRHEASGLSSPFNAEDVDRLSNALIDGVRRDIEFARDLLGRQMPVDETQAVQLTRGQPCDPLGEGAIIVRAVRSIGGFRQPPGLPH